MITDRHVKSIIKLDEILEMILLLLQFFYLLRYSSTIAHTLHTRGLSRNKDYIIRSCICSYFLPVITKISFEHTGVGARPTGWRYSLVPSCTA